MPNETVLLAHGSGGRLTHNLIHQIFLKRLANPWLESQEDAAVWDVPPGAGQMALTTDSYVVSPLFFSGGDIGKLAICGTVNDLAMVGASPLYLTAGFIIEEGLPLADLDRVVVSMAQVAQEAGVQVIAGDTKVVEKGSADSLFINTAGVGVIPEGRSISCSQAKPGDVLIINGSIGVHGLAIMSQREGLRFSFPLSSDCAPLNGLVAAMLQADERIHCLRDPTRGGLATTLNEIATQSQVGIEIEEDRVPIPEGVRGACELLGLDPLYVANEGKLVAIVPPEAEAPILGAMRCHTYGQEAAVIGRVTSGPAGRVVLHTSLGARRILDMLSGAQLPRIC